MGTNYSALGGTGLPDPARVQSVYPKIYTARVTICADPAANADLEVRVTGTATTIARMLTAVGDAFEAEQ